MPSFDDFKLQPATRAALTHMEITEPTPIQVQAIPALLAGSDLVGQSATGSGKTLAYAIPLIERLNKDKRGVQALILVPTRELAIQVNAVLGKLATSRRVSTALLVGGRPYGSQLGALRAGSQIVVGTPGRVKDHLDRGTLVLNQLRMCVLDEADQMLDSGFAPAVEEILVTAPDPRQTALFSATMPDWVATLQKKFLNNPVTITIPTAMGRDNSIEQIAYQVPQDQKMAALCTLLHSLEGESSLIFGKTKYGVEKLGKHLSKLGFTVGTLHGNKSQRAREEVLTAFRRGHVQTLLATNVAARGLDIAGIDQVINYELPESNELFTHRVGRTGRMGKAGKAITLLMPSEVSKWRRMARSLGHEVALQRFVIDENAMTTRASTQPVAEVIPNDVQDEEPRPERDRTPASPRPRRDRREQPGRDRETPSSPQRREFSPGRSETPARPADFPVSERRSYDKPRGERRRAEKPSNFGRNAGRRERSDFATTEPRQRSARRRSDAAPAAYTRRPASSRRYASR